MVATRRVCLRRRFLLLAGVQPMEEKPPLVGAEPAVGGQPRVTQCRDHYDYEDAIGERHNVRIGLAPEGYVVMLIGVWVLLAPFGLWNIGTATATAVAMFALVWMARRQATVTVADTGVRYGFTSPMLPGYDGGFEVPWDNIQGIKGTWLSGSVVFKHPQKLVRKTKKSMAISFLDPKWRTRPTSMAIARRLDGPWEPSSG